jgi:hypothetical protein
MNQRQIERVIEFSSRKQKNFGLRRLDAALAGGASIPVRVLMVCFSSQLALGGRKALSSAHSKI